MITEFGTFENKPVYAYTLSNRNAVQAVIINYGATITKIITPDKNGTPGNVIIGFNSLEDYLKNGNHYIGGTVGRYCNRIANARFRLEDTEYQLAANNGSSCLHGGKKGYDKVLWEVLQYDKSSIKLSYISRDGEEGFPGNFFVELVYTLTDDNELILAYTGHTDKATPVNLTSHGYFNLSGGNDATILNHELIIHADHYSTEFIEPKADALIAPVKNTALDLNQAKKIGSQIQLLPSAYDHNYVLNKSAPKAAELFDPGSGRLMEVFTSEPGLQFYSGNGLDQVILTDANQQPYLKHAALCLEAQHFPNSPNQPLFPNTILQPADIYRQTTVYKFSVK